MIAVKNLCPITSGKTKIIYAHPTMPGMGIVLSKDDITAGDGKRHHVIPGKAKLATTTTVAVFKLLAKHGIPLAFHSHNDDCSFHAKVCDMIPDEVVVRGIAAGSYLKRNPQVMNGTILEPHVVEHFLKTSKREYMGYRLPCDDPYMQFLPLYSAISLHDPTLPLQDRGFLTISSDRLHALVRHRADMERIALNVFCVLADAWRRDLGTLVDLKIEFGVLPNGTLVVADVIDCDSWRVLRNGIQLSKQGYREGDDPSAVLKVYRIAAEICSRWS
jgi:phosphoribosylaminoimidazole-succinocarboxamide synthase